MKFSIAPCLIALVLLAACASEEPVVVEAKQASITMCSESQFALRNSESIARDHCAAWGQTALAQGPILPSCSHTKFFEEQGYMQEYVCVVP